MRLVYVAARMPKAGETEEEDGKRILSDLSESTHIGKTQTALLSLIQPTSTNVCRRCPIVRAECMSWSQVPDFADNLGGVITTAAWRSEVTDPFESVNVGILPFDICGANAASFDPRSADRAESCKVVLAVLHERQVRARAITRGGYLTPFIPTRGEKVLATVPAPVNLHIAKGVLAHAALDDLATVAS